MKKLVLMGAFLAIAGCGGDDGPPPAIMGVAGNTSLAAAPVTTAAVANTPFTFASGVPALGTTAATTVAFTSTAATPTFNITSGNQTATGTTTFGSCIFAVTSSTFPSSHALAVGKTVTVNPCNINVGTAGAQANGAATSRSIALLLGAASSANQTATVGVNAGGQMTLNGNIVGTVTLTPVSG